MYDTPRAALMALTDSVLFERVAVKVLQSRFPGLRITGPSGDLGRDAFARPLVGEADEIVLLVSCDERWTTKLSRDLKVYGSLSSEARPNKAFFVTNCSTKQVDQERYKKDARSLGIALEIVDLNELALDLQSDGLHRIAERDLGVRPREPLVLQSAGDFLDIQTASASVADAPPASRTDVVNQLRDALDPANGAAAPRIISVEGPSGIGKTRLIAEVVAHMATTTLIAGPGTAVTRGSLVDIELNGSSILIVAEADRSPDLSGLAAMFNDARFDPVRVVLTVQPGLTEQVLARICQEEAEVTTITLMVAECRETDDSTQLPSDLGPEPVDVSGERGWTRPEPGVTRDWDKSPSMTLSLKARILSIIRSHKSVFAASTLPLALFVLLVVLHPWTYLSRDFAFTSPRNNSHIPQCVTLKGVGDPREGYTLWVFSQDPNGSYWPLEPVNWSPIETRAWFVTVGVGSENDAGKRSSLILALVPEQLSEQWKGKEHFASESLPSRVEVVAQLDVRRTAELCSVLN